MIKQLEMTGKNKDEAISRALAQLGMDRDDVSVEILELGKTGFLGIGSVPAKVRVSYEVPDEAEAPVASVAPVADAAPTAPKADAASVAAAAPRPPKHAAGAAPVAPKQSRADAASVTHKSPKPPKASVAPVSPAAPKAPTAPASSEGDAGTEERIAAFLTGLMEHMDVAAAPRITRDGDTYEVVLEGEDLGALIGRRGDTLDAIQQLTSYAVNRGRSKRVRIHVDAENYRARREESLRRLASKVAGKVSRSRRSVTLEPMNAYERHVIHAALQDFRGISTHSVGVEPNRRVVISYDPEN